MARPVHIIGVSLDLGGNRRGVDMGPSAFRIAGLADRLTALGITVVIVVQGLINMSVVLGMMPTKGIPLPMISYGGSSLLSTLALLGILMNVSEHAG